VTPSPAEAVAGRPRAGRVTADPPRLRRRGRRPRTDRGRCPIRA